MKVKTMRQNTEAIVKGGAAYVIVPSTPNKSKVTIDYYLTRCMLAT